MTPSISLKATTALQTYINQATTGTSPTIPNAIVHILDTHGTTLFSHGSGSLAPPTASSISIIQSLSKLIGAIAFLQLVERGLSSLDDPSVIPTHLPELAAKQVLTGYTTDASGKKIWEFEDRRGDITPRMLMNHTYGGGHTYMNKLLFEYFKDQADWAKVNEAADTYGTLLASPLLWQPGTKTNYAQGFDWLAVLIERLTGQRLASYLQVNIFDPLGLSSMGYEPAFGGTSLSLTANAGRFWPRVLRAETGLVVLDPASPETVERADAFPAGVYHTGRLGTGLVASARDYAHLLTTLLPSNGGVDPVTHHRLLSPTSVAEITTPCLPTDIQNDSRTIPSSGASPIILPAYLASPHQDPQGSYGLGCGVQGAERVLAGGARGRGKGSVYWYGAANTEYWVDGEEGIVVLVNGNYYPWNEAVWTEFVGGVEGLIYAGLKEEGR
jgi:CubicO group peptidase (beta-lactamase class C family)